MRNQPLPYRARIRQDKNGHWIGQLVVEQVPFLGQWVHDFRTYFDKSDLLKDMREEYAMVCARHDNWSDVDLWKPADDQFEGWSPRTGTFRIYWESGESSDAAIYQDEHGDYWLAPTNWIRPGKLADHWDEIGGLAEMIRP